MPRNCSICTHVNRVEIDKALLSGNAFRNIAERFSVSLGALTRHKEAHLSQRMADVAARHAQADIRTAIDVVAQLKAINGASLNILEEARAARNGTLALQAIDRIHKQIELQAKLINLLDEGTTINVISSPAWIQVRTTIVAALGPFPEARNAVADALAEIEGESGR